MVGQAGWWALLLVLLVQVGCSSDGQAPISSGSGGAALAQPKRVVAAMMSDPPTISDSYISGGSGTSNTGTIPGGDALEELVNAGLVVVDNRGKLHPQLAEAVPSLENGFWKLLPEGGMQTTWTVRPSAEWHDGAAFTSADLVFTAQLGSDRELPFFRDPIFDLVASVEAPDPRTVVVTWTTTYIQADAMFSRYVGTPRPRHLLGDVYAERKEALGDLPYWNDGYVGTGPYRVRQWVRGSHVVLSANDRYVLGRPKVDEVEVRFIPSPDALAANILAGEIQLTMGRNLSLLQALQLRDQWPAGRISVGYKNWIAAYPQQLNPTPPLLTRPQFRQGIFHALDRQELVDTLQAGMVPIADSFLTPSDPFYPKVESSIVKYPFNLARAAQLVESAGVGRGPDGTYRDTAGQPIPLQVQTSADDDAQVSATLALADMWKQFGLATEVFLLPQAQRNDREIVSTYPGVRVWRQPNDAEDLRRFTSSQTPLPENRFVGGNRSRYVNPGLDSLIDRYMSTIPVEERASLLAEIIHHMTEQVTIMGLWYNTEPVAISNRLQNITARDVGRVTEAWNAHEWDLQR